MPTLEYLRSEIERMRVQIGRQRKEILQLQRAGIVTASAESLLCGIQAKVDDLCAAGRDEASRTVQAGEAQGSGRTEMVSQRPQYFSDREAARVLEVARPDSASVDA